MTVSITKASSIFPGNGVFTSFPCDWRIFDETDALVSLVDRASREITPLALNTDYTIVGAGDATGFIVSTAFPVDAEHNLYVRHAVPHQQPTDFTNQGAFFPTMHEDAMDRLEMQIQQLADENNRALQIPSGLSDVDGQIPKFTPLLPLVINAGGTGVEAGDTALTGDMLLRANLASTATGNGASLVGFLHSGTDAVARTVQNKTSDTVSVKDFGAKGDGVTDDTASFMAVIAYVATVLITGNNGGCVKVPAGTYKLSSTLVLPKSTGGGINIVLSGDGYANTVLDFSSAPAGSDGILIADGLFFGIEGLFIKNAPRHGVNIGAGLTAGTGAFATHAFIDRVVCTGCGSNGFNFTNLFMFSMNDCLAFGNTVSGIVFNGMHTSCNVTATWARNNTGPNWSLNGMGYSSFSSCGADSSTGSYGWYMRNMGGVVFNGCGSESNAKDGWYIYSSNASVGSLPTPSQDIHGVVFVGCNVFSNSTLMPGLYATCATITAADNRPIDVRYVGGSMVPATSSDFAFNVSATGGPVTQYLDGLYYMGFSTADQTGGPVIRKNSAVAGLTAIVQLASAFSVPNNVNTIVTWSSAFVSNQLGCTYNGSNGIVIPIGVNRVRVSCSVDFASSSNVGIRQIYIRKNGTATLGLPNASQAAPAAGDGYMSVESAVINVAAGDYITVLVFQNSGGALNVNQSTATWLSVEAVG